MRNKAAALCMVIAILIIIGLRIKGVHLTEGELLIEYKWGWLTALAYMCGALILVRK